MSRTPNLNLWTYNHTDAFWWEWNVKLIYKNDFSKEIFRTKTVEELITQLTSEKKIKVLLSSRHETANSCKPRRITCKNKLAWNFISQQWLEWNDRLWYIVEMEFYQCAQIRIVIDQGWMNSVPRLCNVI